jgi:hypothetical protein
MMPGLENAPMSTITNYVESREGGFLKDLILGKLKGYAETIGPRSCMPNKDTHLRGLVQEYSTKSAIRFGNEQLKQSIDMANESIETEFQKIANQKRLRKSINSAVRQQASRNGLRKSIDNAASALSACIASNRMEFAKQLKLIRTDTFVRTSFQ